MSQVSAYTYTFIIDDIRECCYDIYPGLDSFASVLFGNNELETDAARNRLKHLAHAALQLGAWLEIYFAVSRYPSDEVVHMLKDEVARLTDGIRTALDQINESEMSFDYGSMLLDISCLYKIAIRFVGVVSNKE